MTLHRFTIVLLLMLTFLPVRSQTWYGYSYATDVDGDKWITLTNPDIIMRYNHNGVSVWFFWDGHTFVQRDQHRNDSM